jgi:hypothetical protein
MQIKLDWAEVNDNRNTCTGYSQGEGVRRRYNVKKCISHRNEGWECQQFRARKQTAADLEHFLDCLDSAANKKRHGKYQGVAAWAGV